MSDEVGISRPPQRRTKTEIAETVARFTASGLSRSEFCRRHGMCLATLNRYLKRVCAGEAGSSDGLVAVELADRSNRGHRSAGLVPTLRRGRRIEVSAGFDAPTLERLLRLLEAV
jgi:hypothetical protein